MFLKYCFYGILLISGCLLTICGGLQFAGTIQALEEMPLGWGNMVQYIYFTDKLSWNDARTHCTLLSGDLAKIWNPQLHRYIRTVAFDNYGMNIFTEDYWIGLVETVSGSHKWVSDCTGLDSSFQYNFEGNWNSGEQCFKVKKHGHFGDRKRCGESHGFMCQIQTVGAVCPIVPRLTGVELMTYDNMTNCEDECILRTDCWGYMNLQYPPNPQTCTLVSKEGSGIGSIDIGAKLCFNVTLDVSTGLTPVNSNNNDEPSELCSASLGSTVSVPYATTVVATPSSSIATASMYISPSACLTVIETTNVTVIENVTVTENVTFYQTDFINVTQTDFINVTQTDFINVTQTDFINVTQTDFIYVTQTDFINVTQTDFINVTQTIMTSYMVTESYAVHHTNLVTVTLTSIKAQNITFEAVEAIAEEYVKNLTVDAKTTSSYTRSKTSADDKRESAQFMGLIGVLFVAIPTSLMLVMDARKVYTDICRYEHIFRK